MKHLQALTFREKTLIFFVVTLCLISWPSALDDFSSQFLNDSIIEAGIAFASARSINAIVSVLQTTSISVIASISVGEVLDPINDMVEDFSTVMKYALGSLLLQKLLIEIVSQPIFKILLTLTGIGLIGSLVFPADKFQKFAFKCFVTMAALRYLVVVLVLVNNLFSQLFLNEKINQDLAALGESSQEISALETTSPAVPEPLRKQLEKDIQQRENSSRSLETELAALAPLLNQYSQDVARLTQKYEAYPIADRYNLLAMPSAVKEAKTAKEQAEQAHSLLEAEIADKTGQLAVLRNEISKLNRQLRGESEGIFESIGNAVSQASAQLISLKNQFSYKALKNRMSKAIDTMLHAAVSFLVKTILFPLIFLYVILRLFKLIWHVDLIALVNTGKKEIKHFRKELTSPVTPRT